ncbi:MAG: tetratricopeptide repeat protein, partial [Elusimicrobia bacterium]|nr:tetratricopeptide repeat protein [Elusimicrobiota bacterium]
MLGDALAGKGDATHAREAYQKALFLHGGDVQAELGLARLDGKGSRQDQAQADIEAALKSDPEGYAPRLAQAEALYNAGARKDALPDYQAALGVEDFPLDKAELVGRRLSKLGDYQDSLTAFDRAINFFQGSRQDVARVWLEESQAFAGEGSLDKALEAAKKALRTDESDPRAWLAMGSVEYAMGRPRKALSDADKAVEIAPRSPETLLRRGELFFRTHDAARALADFNSVIALDSGDAQAYNDLGVINSIDFHDFSKADEDLKRALSLDPKNPEFYFNLGLLETRENLFGEALDAFNSALSLGGPQALILKSRAETYARLGDRTEATSDIQALIAQNPKDASAYAALGWIRYRAADYLDAEEAFQKALDIESGNASALWGMGAVHGAQGAPRRALRNLSDALDADPSSSGILLALCQERRAAGDVSASLKACDRGIELAPDYGDLYYQRALDEILRDRPDEALADIKKAEEHGLEIAEEYLAEAAAHAALGKYQEAHEDYQKAYSLNPGAHQIDVNLGPPSADPEGFYNSLSSAGLFRDPDVVDPYAFVLRGDALSNAGHCGAAIEEFSRAIKIGGNLADAYAGRARCLDAQGQYDDAMRDLKTALSSAPAQAFL